VEGMSVVNGAGTVHEIAEMVLQEQVVSQTTTKRDIGNNREGIGGRMEMLDNRMK